MVRFERAAQPSVVERQSTDIGQFSHVARSDDGLHSYAEHERGPLSSWRIQKSQGHCLESGGMQLQRRLDLEESSLAD